MTKWTVEITKEYIPIYKMADIDPWSGREIEGSQKTITAELVPVGRKYAPKTKTKGLAFITEIRKDGGDGIIYKN